MMRFETPPFDPGYFRSLFPMGDARRPPGPGKPATQKWRGLGKTVKAHTRSEARALIRKELGLERLPPGSMVVKVGKPKE